jgi:hypothetical protein
MANASAPVGWPFLLSVRDVGCLLNSTCHSALISDTNALGCSHYASWPHLGLMRAECTGGGPAAPTSTPNQIRDRLRRLTPVKSVNYDKIVRLIEPVAVVPHEGENDTTDAGQSKNARRARYRWSP